MSSNSTKTAKGRTSTRITQGKQAGRINKKTDGHETPSRWHPSSHACTLESVWIKRMNIIALQKVIATANAIPLMMIAKPMHGHAQRYPQLSNVLQCLIFAPEGHRNVATGGA